MRNRNSLRTQSNTRRALHRSTFRCVSPIEALEWRRLLSVDSIDGLVMDQLGNIYDLCATEAGHGSGDYNLTTPWSSSSVTFSFSNLLDGGLPLASGTSISDLRQLTYDALGLWTAVSHLTLVYSDDPGGAVNDSGYDGTGFPQIRVGHHDIPEPGSGLNVLAHCYFPGSNGLSGDMHFDDTDTWGNGSGGGINFLETAAHELGHGIGLLHANGDATTSCPPPKPAIMDACIQNRFTTRDSAYLFADDIAGIQALYGTGLGYVYGADGVARIYGTGVASNYSGDNLITVTTGTVPLFGDAYVISSSGFGTVSIPVVLTNGLIIEGLGGNDIIRVDNNFAGEPITLRGGLGDDYFDFGYNVGALGGMPQGVTVEGGGGDDRIWTYDDNTAAAQTYTITSAGFSRGGWGGFFYDTTVEGLFLRTGNGADIVNVNSTYVGQPVIIQSHLGNDTVNLGTSGAGLTGLHANVQIENNPSYTTININNGSDTVDRTWTVTDVAAGYGGITGIAPATILWDNSDIAAVNLMCGKGVDVGSIQKLSVTLNINNTDNDNYDQITVGSVAAGGLQSILNGMQGGLTIDNDPDFTDLYIDDSGDTTARTATLDLVTSYMELTGLAPATIRFDDSDVRNVTIRSGSGADTINVVRYSGGVGALTVNSVGGQDSVTMGNAVDGVRSVVDPIYIRNAPSYTSLVINSGADTVARSVTIDYDTTSDLESIVGLAPATIYYDPGDILSTYGAVVTTGTADDSVAVLANRRMLSLSTTGSAGEHVTFGPNLDDIDASVYVRDPLGFTAVTVNDTDFATGRALMISQATVDTETFSLLNLFGGNIYLKNADTAQPISVNTGIGPDAIMVAATERTLAINTGAGSDTVDFGLTTVGSRTIDPINAGVTVNGGTGVNRLFAYDIDAVGGSMGVTETTLTSGHSATVNHSGFSSVEVYLSSAGAALNVDNALSSMPVIVNTNVGHDSISVIRSFSEVQIRTSEGLDNVLADSSDVGNTSRVVLMGAKHDLGTLMVGNGGRVVASLSNASIRVRSLSPMGGRIEIGSGFLIVNYTGATPAATVRGALLTGYNGGAWNGAGILSTVAAITPNYSVGYGEASAIRGTFPTTFGTFTDVDNTSILISYTLIGDATLDHAVNFDDLLKLAQGYAIGVTGKVWTQGDFDYNGIVNFDDLLKLAQLYGSSFATDWARATTPTTTRVFNSRKTVAESLLQQEELLA